MSEKHTQRIVELGMIGEWLLGKIEVIKTCLTEENSMMMPEQGLPVLAQLEAWHEELTEDIIMLTREGELDSKDDWWDYKPRK